MTTGPEGKRPIPRVFGLAGWSGSGKTTLMERLIPALTARGLSVSTLKHAHHDFDLDKPGKDSWRHREAGAREVMVASARRWALQHELAGAEEPTATELLRRMSPVDLVLIEGFKREGHDKLEVYRPSVGKPPLWPDDPFVVAVASDTPLPDCGRPLLPLDDPDAIAAFIVRHCALGDREVA